MFRKKRFCSFKHLYPVSTSLSGKKLMESKWLKTKQRKNENKGNVHINISATNNSRQQSLNIIREMITKND